MRCFFSYVKKMDEKKTDTRINELLFLNKSKSVDHDKRKSLFTSISMESCIIVCLVSRIHRPVNVIVVLKLFRRLIVKITFSLYNPTFFGRNLQVNFTNDFSLQEYTSFTFQINAKDKHFT